MGHLVFKNFQTLKVSNKHVTLTFLESLYDITCTWDFRLTQPWLWRQKKKM